MIFQRRHGYTAAAKILHWLILALLLVQFAIAWTMPHIGRNTRPGTLINLHFSIGIVILAVVIVRLLWRLTHQEPPPEAGVPPWQVGSARVVHWLLYLLLFVVPILGWINASWRGFPVALFGLELPKLIATRAPGWVWTGDVHTLLASYAMLTLVGLHVAAALYHWLVRRDRVLQRMLP
jgi:cytochrome b561